MAEKKKPTEETPKPKCGIIMPISAIDDYSAEHWAEVKEILLEVISQTEFEGDLVSNANEIRIIHETIVQNIYFNEMVICDVSGKNPNVMFELGLRIAFDKPVIVIKDDATNYSFDTSPIEHLEYPTDLNYRRINQFKQELKDKIKATFEKAKTGSPYLKSFGRIEVSKLESSEVSSQEYILKTLDDIKNQLNDLQILKGREANVKKTSIRNDEDLKRFSQVVMTFSTKEDTKKAFEFIQKAGGISQVTFLDEQTLLAQLNPPMNSTYIEILKGSLAIHYLYPNTLEAT